MFFEPKMEKLSLEELVKKEPQITLNETPIFPQTHQTSSHRFYQPDSKYFNSAEASSLEKTFNKFQTDLNRLLNEHYSVCPYTAQRGLLQIRPKDNLISTDDLTIRYNYNYSCAVQMQDQFRQYDKFLELQKKATVDLNKKRTSSKNVQSKFKNTYGLIVGRVVKSCKEYFREKQEHGENMITNIDNGRFKYIHERLSCQQYINLESFQRYLNSYYNRDPELKKKRGKFIVQEYLMQEPINGSILADLIIMFLDQENSDFQNYTCNDSKPKGQILKVLLNPQDLEKLRDKFKEMEIAINDLEWRCKKLHKKEEEM